MESIAILGVTGNAVQLVDFTLRLVSKASEIREAGRVVEHDDFEKTSTELVRLATQLRTGLESSGTALSANDGGLRDMCTGCIDVGKEIESALNRIKIKGSKTRWKSFRQALKAIWGADKLGSMKSRLDMYGEQLDRRMLAVLKADLTALNAKSDGHTQDLRHAIPQALQQENEKLIQAFKTGTVKVTRSVEAARDELLQQLASKAAGSSAEQLDTRTEVTLLRNELQRRAEQLSQELKNNMEILNRQLAQRRQSVDNTLWHGITQSNLHMDRSTTNSNTGQVKDTTPQNFVSSHALAPVDDSKKVYQSADQDVSLPLAESTANVATADSTTSSTESYMTRRSIVIHWYCCQCGDGPYLDWQMRCQACFIDKCSGCTRADILEFSVDATRKSQTTAEHNGMNRMSKDKDKRKRKIQEREPLSDYQRIEPHDWPLFFSLGRVFRARMPEPVAASGSTDSLYKLQDQSHVSTKTFVVHENKKDYSICLEVSTYGGKGTLHRGVDPMFHAIIYTDHEDNGPYLLPGEDKIIHVPIKVVGHNDRRLPREARIDFEGRCMIAHDLQVMNLGQVVDEHLRLLKEPPTRRRRWGYA